MAPAPKYGHFWYLCSTSGEYIQVDCGVNLLRIFAMVVAMNVWESLGLMANPSFKRMEMVISNHFPSNDLDHQVSKDLDHHHIWIIIIFGSSW